jgi:hypothetical protein
VRRNKRSGPAPIAVLAAVAAVACGVGVLLSRLGRSRGGGSEARDDPRNEQAGEHTWRCRCGQEFRVSGEGRHSVYWLIDADPGDPVLDGRCPNCGRTLPDHQVAEAA